MSVTRLVLILILVVLAAFGAYGLIQDARMPKPEAPLPEPGEFKMVSPAFEHEGMIPARYTADGANVSPPLVWENVPAGTVTFALMVEDPDATTHTFTHWVICEISGAVRELPEAIPAQEMIEQPLRASQGQNSFREPGYGGPSPPEGATHRYYFRLFALDVHLDMTGGFGKNQLRTAMRDHVLGEAAMMGKYGR